MIRHVVIEHEVIIAARKYVDGTIPLKYTNSAVSSSNRTVAKA